MTTTLTPVLSATWGAERSWTMATYEDHGGYGALRKALATTGYTEVKEFQRVEVIVG